RVFRVMRKEPDGLPTVSPTSLGVRPGVDVDLDAQNNVLVTWQGDVGGAELAKNQPHPHPEATAGDRAWRPRKQQHLLLPHGEWALSARGLRQRSYPGAGLGHAR